MGLGGHSRALLDAGATRVLGLDRDRDALRLAGEALAEFGDRVELVHADYRDLPDVLDARGIPQVDGALADLGISSMQLGATHYEVHMLYGIRAAEQSHRRRRGRGAHEPGLRSVLAW